MTQAPAITILPPEAGWIARVAHAGAFICGGLYLFFGCFAALLEAFTTPQLGPAGAWLMTLGSGYAAAHGVIELVRRDRAVVVRWAIFFIVLGLLYVELWTIQGANKQGVIIIAVSLGLGAAWIGIAHLIASGWTRVVRAPVIVRVWLLPLAWCPLAVPFGASLF